MLNFSLKNSIIFCEIISYMLRYDVNKNIYLLLISKINEFSSNGNVQLMQNGCFGGK